MSNERKGLPVMMSTGIMFYPFDPRPDEVHIQDISWHLSTINRYNGAAKPSFPVAAHSLIGTQECLRLWPKDFDTAFRFMLHDSQEAYAQDFIRPIKDQIPVLTELELSIQRIIAIRYGIDEIMTDKVIEVDNNMLRTEFEVLMPEVPAGCRGTKIEGIDDSILEMAELSDSDVDLSYMLMFTYLANKCSFDVHGFPKV